MNRQVGVAIVGIGSISGIYLKNITTVFRELRIAGIYDLMPDRAQKAAAEYGIEKVYSSMQELLADPAAEIILNLTRPAEHYQVIKDALLAGKHGYTEKPLAATLEQAAELVKLAEEKGLLLGGAPDTFLGAGIQTCRKLIDSDMIGSPIGAAAFMVCRGHESWHPDPEFYYKKGGGPLLDMGPYYLTALVNLLGGVKSVAGAVATPFSQRIITSQPRSGDVIDVEVATTVAGMLHFENGALGTLYTTFDVYYPAGSQARIEIYGTKGTLVVPDPNGFGGPIRLLRPEQGEYRDMPLLFDYQENSRALGLADMAKALCTGRRFRATGAQAYHVLEIMVRLLESAEQGKTLPLSTRYDRGPAMENNPVHGILDK